jgi:hypothetical protein
MSVKAHHDHPADAACTPACPGWAEGVLQLYALQRRFPDMLAACRAAEAIECLYIAPEAQGTVLPEYLQKEDLVRLNLVVGRDTPEVLLDEWGVRCELTFRGRRFECAFPWHSILGGVLRAPPRKRPRFGVIDGAEEAPSPVPANAAETEASEPPRPPAPRPAGPPRLGVIQGGKKD